MWFCAGDMGGAAHNGVTGGVLESCNEQILWGCSCVIAEGERDKRCPQGMGEAGLHGAVDNAGWRSCELLLRIVVTRDERCALRRPLRGARSRLNG